MRKVNLIWSLLAVVAALSLQGCLEDKCKETRTFTQYLPVYVTPESIRIDIVGEQPRALENPGKLYFYDHYVLVNELREGIHVIDNQDPYNPTPVAFIPIPGNVDMAVRGNHLYADSYIDLLTIDFSNPVSPQLVKREQDVFSLYDFHPDYGYVSHYEKSNVTETINCNHQYWGVDVWMEDSGVFMSDQMATGTTVDLVNIPNQPVGIAGSMARFGIASGHLYAIDYNNLYAFTLADPANPVQVGEESVGWGIETLFPHGEHLFIGSESGMFIFDNSNPSSPVYQSVFEHPRACDPVYVSGDRAFVTLRDGTTCEGFFNQLDVVDISDLNNPSLLRTYPMQHPHGLSVTPSDRLYLCEGSHGIKVLDVSDSHNVNQLGELRGFDAYDAISLSESHLMVIGKDGFFQFDVSDPADIQQMSLIAVD